MASEYKGMRWLKCDLQMQTPADKDHWNGERLEKGKEADAAKEYAKACFEAGLDVVGITDHNFLSKDFIPYLREAFDDIERQHGRRITLFPGFEFEAAGVGRGVHVLCLFEKDCDLATIDSILTECGVSHPRINPGTNQLEKSDKNIKDVLQIVQKKHHGLVVLPHLKSTDGLFDNDCVSEWLQQDQFKNPYLLAVEVPKPVKRMSKAFQALFTSGEDCIPEWKRIRPIATLMSSDNKKLIEKDKEGKPVPNSIGYRYSWIKMSDPSVMSLKQAFLDHESRIILPDDVTQDIHPDDRQKHSRIKSVRIRGVNYLADTNIHLSPNFNCIIGPRGSGKSTVIEYMRILFGKDRNEDFDDGTRNRIARITNTLQEDHSELELDWVNENGVPDCLLWRDGKVILKDRPSDSDAVNVNLILDSIPIRFFSQQELNQFTETDASNKGFGQAQRLLELLDAFKRNKMHELKNDEINAIQEFEQACSDSRTLSLLDQQLSRLQTELTELERQWTIETSIAPYIERHRRLIAERRYRESIFGGDRTSIESIQQKSENFVDSHESPTMLVPEHEDRLLKIDQAILNAKREFQKSVNNAAIAFLESIDKLTSESKDWIDIFNEVDDADSMLEQACKLNGFYSAELGRLSEINSLKTKKYDEIQAFQSRIHDVKNAAMDPEDAISKLIVVWNRQFNVRLDAVKQANEESELNSGTKFIQVDISYQLDRLSFESIWQDFKPVDGRTRLSRAWEDIGEELFNAFRSSANKTSPWELLRGAVFGDSPKLTCLDQFNDDLVNHILENDGRWVKLRTTRVRDIADLILFRSDGSLAGSIASGALSDGQRNTATLALLLANNDGPLIIDQPEDELDSNFVFKHLIPMIRKIKNSRQIIVATHQANLPVNGDAEAIFAFDTVGSQGNIVTQGGMDRKDVTNAILDVMEGTEEAFRKRREKYTY